MDFEELVDPSTTAVVTMELQRGVVGDLAALPHLRDAADAVDMVTNAGRVCGAARSAGATVVHCTAEFRPDRKGSATNARILAASAQLNGDRLDRGHPGTELIDELAVDPGDLIVPRTHGLTPFVATDLDQLLRNCGVRTVVAVGNSINIGILGLVLVAVDLGYQVVVPRDAVVGVPVEYGEAVIDNTIALLATLTTTAELAAVWSR
jgi:nicotinamidase-related amidase